MLNGKFDPTRAMIGRSNRIPAISEELCAPIKYLKPAYPVTVSSLEAEEVLITVIIDTLG